MQSSMWSSQQIASAHTQCVLQRTTCALVPYNAAKSVSKGYCEQHAHRQEALKEVRKAIKRAGATSFGHRFRSSIARLGCSAQDL